MDPPPASEACLSCSRSEPPATASRQARSAAPQIATRACQAAPIAGISCICAIVLAASQSALAPISMAMMIQGTTRTHDVPDQRGVLHRTDKHTSSEGFASNKGRPEPPTEKGNAPGGGQSQQWLRARAASAQPRPASLRLCAAARSTPSSLLATARSRASHSEVNPAVYFNLAECSHPERVCPAQSSLKTEWHRPAATVVASDARASREQQEFHSTDTIKVSSGRCTSDNITFSRSSRSRSPISPTTFACNSCGPPLIIGPSLPPTKPIPFRTRFSPSTIRDSHCHGPAALPSSFTTSPAGCPAFVPPLSREECKAEANGANSGVRCSFEQRNELRREVA
jgi:hypothetical protein